MLKWAIFTLLSIALCGCDSDNNDKPSPQEQITALQNQVDQQQSELDEIKEHVGMQ